MSDQNAEIADALEEAEEFISLLEKKIRVMKVLVSGSKGYRFGYLNACDEILALWEDR